MTKEYKRKDCTHVLSCTHCIGRNYLTYTMDCIPLKEMNNGRIKIVVFGDRYWKGNLEKNRIRYVESWRVKKGRLNPDYYISWR